MMFFRKKKSFAIYSKALCKRQQHSWMLHVASVCTPCCMLLGVVAQSFKSVKLLSQQLPTFLLFRDRRNVAQQCQIRLHSSSNIGEFTQQDVRKKRTAKRLCVTNVTGLLLACFVLIFTFKTLMISGLLQKDLFKAR